MRCAFGLLLVGFAGRIASAQQASPPQQQSVPVPEVMPTPPAQSPPSEPVERISLELAMAAGGPLIFPTTGRIGLGIDAAVVPMLSVNAAIAQSGGDGWSGAQYAVAVRAHRSLVAGHHSIGGLLGLAVGPYGYHPIIGEWDTRSWDRAYFLRLQLSTESTGRFHTRWFAEINALLNPSDGKCPSGGDCDDGGKFLIGGGVALAFGLL